MLGDVYIKKIAWVFSPGKYISSEIYNKKNKKIESNFCI